jgi:protein-disulfide isomerase
MTSHPSRLVLPVNHLRDHIRGRIDAPLTLLEYGDYECPFCGAAHPVVEEVRRRMGGQLRFVYRHFPLTKVHRHAQSAAEAAEAAGAQGRFWLMHDRLFAYQRALDDESLLVHARAVGLELASFMLALAAGTFAPKVEEDFVSGVRSGVAGTPTFFVNDIRYEGPRDVDSLINALEEFAHVESPHRLV